MGRALLDSMTLRVTVPAAAVQNVLTAADSGSSPLLVCAYRIYCRLHVTRRIVIVGTRSLVYWHLGL